MSDYIKEKAQELLSQLPIDHEFFKERALATIENFLFDYRNEIAGIPPPLQIISHEFPVTLYVGGKRYDAMARNSDPAFTPKQENEK